MEQELYTLPDGWEWRTLGEVATLINGRAYKKKELLEKGPVPVLRVGNFFSNRNWYYSDLDLPPEKYCNDGDLLYAWSASFGPKIWNGPKAIFHYHIWKIVTSEEIDKYFLYRLLEFDSKEIKAQGSGVAMTHATKGGMEKRYIPLPPLEEQKRIVTKLNELFTRIDIAIGHLQDNLKLTKDLFTNVLDSYIDSSWKLKTFDEIKLSNVIGLVRNVGQQSGSRSFPYIKMNNITQCGDMDLSNYTKVDCSPEEAKKFSLKNGDFLFNTRNSKELVGKSAVFEIPENKKSPYWLYNNNIMRVRFDATVSPYFVNYLFQSSFIKSKLEELKSNTTNVSAIYYKKLKTLELPIPSYEEQRKVLTALDALSKRTRAIETATQEKLRDLEALKASLLHNAFRGQL